MKDETQFDLWISEINNLNEFTKIELARKAWNEALNLTQKETTVHLGGCI